MACRIVVLISGGGSNLQSLIDAAQSDQLAGGSVVAVISNKAEAGGLERARAAGISTACIAHGDFDSRESFDDALKTE